MRRLLATIWRPQSGLIILSALFLGFFLSGCSSTNTQGIPTTISITPAGSISLAYGQVRELTAQVLDNNGNVMTGQSFVWSSSNTSIASVSGTGGQCGDTTNSTSTSCICAGTWDSRYINCTAPTKFGMATITVSSGGISATMTALVHAPVARVTVSPASVNCLSATGTQQLTAFAYDGQGNDITSQVAIDATSFTWTSSDSTVVSISNTGLATAVNPGVARVYAAIGGTSSPPGSFTTCPVVSITLSTGSTGDTFSVAQTDTQQLTATTVDSNGKTITVTSGRLAYNSSVANALSVDTTGLVTGENPGGSTIVASCSPPNCNNGLFPIYSNVIDGTTSGTTATGNNTSSGQVLVASPSSTAMYPVALNGTNTPSVGEAIQLPYYPNSLVYDTNSSNAYMGSDAALMEYAYTAPTTCTNTSTTTCTIVATIVTAIPGVILHLSADGSVITLYNDVTKTVTIYGITESSIIDQFQVPSATTPTTIHASTSPDGQTTYVVTGNTLYVSNTTTSLQTVTLGAAANDVAFLLQGSFAYLAGGEPSSVSARATCDAVEKDIIAVNAIPDRIIGSGDGTKIFAVAGSVMNTITPTTTGAGCPPSVTDTLTATDLGLGTIAPTQIFTDSFGKYVFMVSSSGQFIIYNTSSNTAATVALSSGTATTGDAILDASGVWVGGGSDDKIHLISTSSNTDTQQVTVPISADLVAVRKQ